jgi:hypothetical protein
MTQPDDGPFALFGTDAHLPYDDDEGPGWRAFYERGALTERLVAEDDIEAYDWDNQALILTEGASRRFEDRIRGFIAVLGEKRLYGGQGLHPFSARAVGHPVIYTLNLEGRTVLLVRPFHFQPRPDKEYRETIASTDVRKHFERMGKLRRPWSERAFLGLWNSVHRIRGLRAAATESALEMQYELEGTRVGGYDLEETLSWTNGRDGMDFGPRYSCVVRLDHQKSSRKAVFPYAEFARDYWNSGYAAYQAKLLSEGSAWRMAVRIWPVLEEKELTSLGLVETINLHLLRWYGGDSADLDEAGAGRPSHAIGDRKTIELPADWDKIRRRMRE